VEYPSVVAFPLHRRRKLVRGIARLLEAKNGEDANVFWRSTAKHLLAQLAASGVTTQAAEQEVRTLLQSVLQEMRSRSDAASA
jgi:hypothetical protein